MKKMDKEIEELKKCIREKDKRISKIENRYLKIVYSLIIICVIFLSLSLAYLIGHIQQKLPASFSRQSWEVIDLLQFIGYPILCFLAISGLVAWLIFLYFLFKTEDV